MRLIYVLTVTSLVAATAIYAWEALTPSLSGPEMLAIDVGFSHHQSVMGVGCVLGDDGGATPKRDFLERVGIVQVDASLSLDQATELRSTCIGRYKKETKLTCQAKNRVGDEIACLTESEGKQSELLCPLKQGESLKYADRRPCRKI